MKQNYLKIGVPTHPSLIERPHLQKSLVDALNYRVILVNAPPGCGKTVLASQFAAQINASVAWHTITFYEQDMRSFYARLLANLGQLLPDIHSLTGLINQQPEVVAHEIATYLRDHADGELVYVLDDWHVFGTQADATRWLRAFVASMPSNCHLVILSRTLPSLDMVQMVARRAILAIPQEDLFFSESEVFMLAAKLHNGSLPPGRIQQVWKQMHGWPAGIILALQPMANLLPYEFDERMPNSEALFQSIAREMLNQQPPDVQQFLKWTSCLDYITPELCQNVLDLQDATALLSDVIQRNLFILQQDSHYNYHQLFRAFLQASFRLHQPAEYASAHRRIAGWYQGRGEYDRAFDHFMDAGAVQQAAALVERLVYSYFAQGRIEILRHFGDTLSDYDVRTPHFDHIRGKMLLDYDGDIEGAETYLDSALQQFRESGEIDWELQILQQKANILVQQGEFIAARDMFQQVYDHKQSPDVLRGDALERIAWCDFSLGNTETARDTMEAARELIDAHGGPFARSNLLQDLEIIYRTLGDVEKANICLQQLVALRRRMDNAEALALALNNLGYRYYEQGMFRQARETLQQGMEASNYHEGGRSRYYLHASMGDLERDTGAFDQAREHYQEALYRSGAQEPAVRCEVLIHLSTMYRWQGRLESASTCARDALELARKHNLKHYVNLARIADWHLRLQPWNVAYVESEIEHFGASDGLPEFQLLMLRMLLFSDSFTEVNDMLSQIERDTAAGRSPQGLIAETYHTKEFDAYIRGNRYPKLERHYNALRRAAAEPSNRMIIPITPPTYNLQLVTLGVESIRRDGAYLKISDWQSAQARELFFYMVFNGKVHRNTVCLMFWPDKSPDAASDNFHQLITRIRTALGNQVVIYDDHQDTYSINPNVHLWCDALRLEDFVTEAQKLSPNSIRAFDLWYQASELVQGDFLPSFDREWIMLRREQYNRLSLEVWMGLGACYRTQGDCPSAIRAYESAVHIDPYYEAAYRGRMECWSQLGETAAVIASYEELASLLRKELDATPSSETTNLLKKLTA